jgi:mono/diheme cytochrome c family protein
MFLLTLLLPACQQQMASQPSVRPDEASGFFADGRANRPVVPGTVPRGHLRTDAALFTGLNGEETPEWVAPALQAGVGRSPLSALVLEAARQSSVVDTFPFPAKDMEKVLQHGKNRYMIYCVVCHDPLGTGRGMIVQRGYTAPPSYHSERLRKVRVGHFFRVMTLGYGSMSSYREQIPPRDRWAIAAYIRALQWSQHFPINELPPDMRQEWQAHEKSLRVARATP